ncbi:MAG: LPS-assembly protein LptD, partial [Hyphomicrobiales bacterium]|nr:LPS-assembly protein LptD [Hyphomicrobiales bacterium]
MGPSISSPNAARRRAQSAARLRTTTAPCAMKFVALIALGLAAPAMAHAETVAPPSAPVAAAAQNPDRLVLEANELVYDKDHDTVTAQGAVQLYYKHRILQADKVIYNRTTKRLYAEGHAKLTDERGNVTYAQRFDLTDDFAAG